MSVPHLAAYNTALRSDSDQQNRSSYIGLMRQEGKAEDILSEDDGRRLRAMYDGKIPAAHVDAYVDFFHDRAALTGALAWYRAMTAALADLPSVSVPTTYVWSDGDWAIGRAWAETSGEHVTSRTTSSSSPTPAIGSPRRRRPTSPPRSSTGFAAD